MKKIIILFIAGMMSMNVSARHFVHRKRLRVYTLHNSKKAVTAD